MKIVFARGQTFLLFEPKGEMVLFEGGNKSVFSQDDKTLKTFFEEMAEYMGARYGHVAYQETLQFYSEYRKETIRVRLNAQFEFERMLELAKQEETKEPLFCQMAAMLKDIIEQRDNV